MTFSLFRRLRTGRLLVLLVAAALTLAGCGQGQSQGQSAGAEAAAAAEGTDAFPRVVKHELGETKIPTKPERVVAVTDGGELASLLALGVEPVGFGQRNDPLTPWIKAAGGDKLESYDLAGTEVSFERIAAWKPDLILVQAGFATKENLAQYSALAPTVVTSFIDWKDNLRQVSEATGTTERAAELIAENDAAVEDAAKALAGSKGLKVQAVTVFEGPEIYRLNDASPLGKLAPSLGLAPFPAAGAEGEAVDTVSLEKLTEIDADVLLVQTFDEGDAPYQALKEQEIWKRIPAVKAGKVIELTPDESQASYFDSVLTVPLNLQMLQDRLG
jgi:iron complex transport system substrate-binding protein